MYLHSYYWQEPTIALIIVAPRRPLSMFRIVVIIIFRLLICRSRWPSSSAYHVLVFLNQRVNLSVSRCSRKMMVALKDHRKLYRFRLEPYVQS